MGVGGFAAMRALSTRNDDPTHASRPFDADRDGFIIGEGAGMVILEALEVAQKRGAKILAEIVGYGMSGDAYHITAPAEGGDGGYRVMRNAALKDAGIGPDEVELRQRPRHFDAHRRRHRNRRASSASSATTPKKLPISSTKSMTGHLLGGAGGLEAGISVLALRDQIMPPTINYEKPDPACDLDYIPNVARKAEVNYVLSQLASASAAPTPP